MLREALDYLPVFANEEGERTFIEAYERLMELWPAPYNTLEIGTEFGMCHVIVSGPEEGEPVLMFHGMTSNSALWYSKVEALSGCRIYCVDTPGDFGRSKAVKRIRTPEDAARWMDQLADALALASATFIGHSLGGWFCANYAVTRPERIKRLVLLAPAATFLPAPFGKLFINFYPALWFPKPERTRRAWHWMCSRGYSLPPHVLDVVVAAFSNGRLQLSFDPRVIGQEAWNRLSAPVLFIVGDEEKLYDAERVIKRVREQLPKSAICKIEQAGHCLMLEQQEAVNGAIRAFMVRTLT